MIKAFLVISFFIPFAARAQYNSGSIHSTDTIRSMATNYRLTGGHEQSILDKPKPFTFLTHVPGDILQIAKTPFERNNLKGLGIVAASTAAFLPFDQRITNTIGKTSQHIGLKPSTEYDRIMGVGVKTLVKWPDNLNSAFYQLGEGTPTLAVTGLLFIYGKVAQDNRAAQTASDLVEAYVSMGITVQMLKRISGRQAPFKATVPGGRWQPFPPLSKYQRRTTEYDAFPSGHLATMMATITVLAKNYPEKKWITPVGYVLTGLTGWSMVNNKVHWTSDFPLGIGIGYLAGKLAYKRHERAEARKEIVL